jgi:hypothetical protein
MTLLVVWLVGFAFGAAVAWVGYLGANGRSS